MRSNKNIGMKSVDKNNKEIVGGTSELNSDLNNINKEKMAEKNEIEKNTAFRELDDDVGLHINSIDEADVIVIIIK